ncbi:hypothetical protein, partial [Bacillus cereus group sp. BfR-BA-01517]
RENAYFRGKEGRITMIKSPAKKQGILYLSDGRNLAASAFRCYPASAARISGHFALSHEAKSASRSRA